MGIFSLGRKNNILIETECTQGICLITGYEEWRCLWFFCSNRNSPVILLNFFGKKGETLYPNMQPIKQKQANGSYCVVFLRYMLWFTFILG